MLSRCGRRLRKAPITVQACNSSAGRNQMKPSSQCLHLCFLCFSCEASTGTADVILRDLARNPRSSSKTCNRTKGGAHGGQCRTWPRWQRFHSCTKRSARPRRPPGPPFSPLPQAQAKFDTLEGQRAAGHPGGTASLSAGGALLTATSAVQRSECLIMHDSRHRPAAQLRRQHTSFAETAHARRAGHGAPAGPFWPAHPWGSPLAQSR